MTRKLKRGVYGALLGVVLWALPALATSDGLGEFIAPVSNPTNFEDPRVESDVRPLYVYHSLSNTFLDSVQKAGLQAPGGSAQIVAVQLRLKLMERLALIATKDGYVWVSPNHSVDNVVTNGNGFANVAGGLKYNFFKDVTLPALATAGVRYEVPSGEPQALQGSVFRSHNVLGADLNKRGSGVLNLFLSGAWGIGNAHLMGYTGPRVAMSAVDSSFYDTSLHLDYKLGSIYPLVEFNWVHVIDGGNRLQPIQNAGVNMRDEGVDFFNLGAPSAAGMDVATVAFGGRWRITDNLDVLGQSGGVDFGAVAEFPVTGYGSVFGWRMTTDLIFWVM